MLPCYSGWGLQSRPPQQLDRGACAHLPAQHALLQAQTSLWADSTVLRGTPGSSSGREAGPLQTPVWTQHHGITRDASKGAVWSARSCPATEGHLLGTRGQRPPAALLRKPMWPPHTHGSWGIREERATPTSGQLHETPSPSSGPGVKPALQILGTAADPLTKVTLGHPSRAASCTRDRRGHQAATVLS